MIFILFSKETSFVSGQNIIPNEIQFSNHVTNHDNESTFAAIVTSLSLLPEVVKTNSTL